MPKQYSSASQVSVILVWSCQLAKLMVCGNCCLGCVGYSLSSAWNSCQQQIKEGMVATLLFKKSVSCGGNKFKRVLQKFEEELVFLLSVQNRGCCLFLLLWWPKVLGLNAKGNLPLTSHGTELVSFGQTGNDRNEVLLLPTALLIISWVFLGIFQQNLAILLCPHSLEGRGPVLALQITLIEQGRAADTRLWISLCWKVNLFSTVKIPSDHCFWREGDETCQWQCRCSSCSR